MNLSKTLAKLTGTKASQWLMTSGPDSGCGVDYYLVRRATKTEKAMEAWCNDDQGYWVITVNGETLFDGMEEDDEN